MTTAYKWQPLSDLPDDPHELTDGELESLLRVWQNQRDHLVERQALTEFNQRLRREWAIETGVIEDVYTLDRGITQTLIKRGIDAAFITRDATNRDTTLVARIIQDQYDVLEGLFDFVAGRRPLSTSYVKELHAALLRNSDTHVVQDQFGKTFEKLLEKGAYKTSPNSPTRRDGAMHQYAPPEQTASEMDELIRMHLEHESRQSPPEVSAAWLHHRFTQIHPFADGNGRVARALATLVFIRAGWFPLVIRRDDRVRYIDALERADEGDLRPLIDLFVEVQRNLLIAATEIGEDVRPVMSAHDAILAARDRLLHQGKVALPSWLVAKETAAKLVPHAVQKLEETAAELTKEIGVLRPGFAFTAGRKGPVPDEFSATALLTLTTDTYTELTLSFDAIGPKFRGLVGVAPNMQTESSLPKPIEGGTFLINYEEDLASATVRFTKWLDRVIVNGLNQWRLTL